MNYLACPQDAAPKSAILFSIFRTLRWRVWNRGQGTPGMNSLIGGALGRFCLMGYDYLSRGFQIEISRLV